MAYTSPKTFGVGVVSVVGDFNTYVRDNVAWLGTDAPGCRVYNSANLSIANNTDTAATFDSESFDVGACHSTSTNTGRITVPSGASGVWLVGAHAQWAASNAGNRIIYIHFSASAIIARGVVKVDTGTTGGNTDQSLLTAYRVAAGDYFEMRVYQDSGGALNLLRTSDYSAAFWAHWVRS